MKDRLDALNAVTDVVMKYRSADKGGKTSNRAILESLFTFY